MDLIPESAAVVRELSEVTGTDVAADVLDVADRVGGAICRADLDFETRRRAEAAPPVLEHGAVVNRAIGFLMAQRRADAAEASRGCGPVAA